MTENVLRIIGIVLAVAWPFVNWLPRQRINRRSEREGVAVELTSSVVEQIVPIRAQSIALRALSSTRSKVVFAIAVALLLGCAALATLAVLTLRGGDETGILAIGGAVISAAVLAMIVVSWPIFVWASSAEAALRSQKIDAWGAANTVSLASLATRVLGEKLDRVRYFAVSTTSNRLGVWYGNAAGLRLVVEIPGACVTGVSTVPVPIWFKKTPGVRVKISVDGQVFRFSIASGTTSVSSQKRAREIRDSLSDMTP